MRGVIAGKRFDCLRNARELHPMRPYCQRRRHRRRRLLRLTIYESEPFSQPKCIDEHVASLTRVARRAED